MYNLARFIVWLDRPWNKLMIRLSHYVMDEKAHRWAVERNKRA